MGTFVSILIFIVAILLILVVLVQNPKGGLASNFSSSNQVMGVRKTADVLEKATWTLGIALVFLTIVSAGLNKLNVIEVENTSSEVKEELQENVDIVPPAINNNIVLPDNQQTAPPPASSAPAEEE